jgi:hypothetical protein|tara:strand:+ start:1220 stop:1453 length:234 start_codon:yes stop_codon:yes gene_type:complete
MRNFIKIQLFRSENSGIDNIAVLVDGGEAIVNVDQVSCILKCDTFDGYYNISMVGGAWFQTSTDEYNRLVKFLHIES